MSRFMLEYLKYRPTEEQAPIVILHHNYVGKDGRFDHRLDSNGYRPLAVFTDEISMNENYEHLCRWLHKYKPSYDDAKQLAEVVRDAITNPLTHTKTK